MDMFTQEQLHELAQRIARLELSDEHKEEHLERIEKSLGALSSQFAVLNHKITRWEGKFGGVIFVVGCVWTFLLAAWDKLLTLGKMFLTTTGGGT